ncbi:MAG: TIGR03960 family B12-binding radical SAM protein [Thermodesulfobacteriota bacterium]|nr:TIGR03960 family B12-binding radical SAM protein [Thermodesulfobacteriota bacterium]
MNSCDALLHVNRPARYLGGEAGSIIKDPASVDVRFALAFPDTYEIGMSHIGSAILYHVLNQPQWLAAERTYCPWPDMEEQMRAESAVLSSLESNTPLSDFDLVGFSLQYELCYTNVVNMLNLADIPALRCERNEHHPLIVVGGPCAFNPEPISDFIDCALIGDGEEAVIELCSAVRVSRNANETREQLLERLRHIEGIYLPHLFEVSYTGQGQVNQITPLRDDYLGVKRRFVKDLDKAAYPTKPLVPFMHTVHDRVAMEIARGCTRGCRFCQAGYIYRPVRERQASTIIDVIDQSLKHSGYNEVSLLSLSSGDYSAIEPLLQNLMERYANERVAVSLPSLRVGSLTDELIEEVRKVRKTGFTLAPEAGTERLRQVINKGIKAEDLLTTSRTIYTLGWRMIKLYFMMGLPTETREDLDGIVDLAFKVKRSSRGTEGGGDVNVSVSTFIPKPHTPFQWDAQLNLEQTIERQRYLRDALQKKKLRLKWHEAQLSILEGVFARGDRRLGKVILRAVELGCRFDGWREQFRFDLWQQALDECGLEIEFYLRQREEDETLPWDHIDCGIPKSFFIKERHNALALQYTPDCRSGKCSQCGICDFDQLKMRYADSSPTLPTPTPAPGQGEERYKLRLRLHKTGNARYISHLEFMTVLQRALRRRQIPIRFSQGFHPHPRLSFPDALPTGVQSLAEIVDIELFSPYAAEDVLQRLREELPDGFDVESIDEVHWRTPSPGASILSSDYHVPLGNMDRNKLQHNIDTFLAADTADYQRHKGDKITTIDLRGDVQALQLGEDSLIMTLTKGSPIAVAAHLLGLDANTIRTLGICKTNISLKELPTTYTD